MEQQNTLCYLLFLWKPISDIMAELNFELKERRAWCSKINYEFVNGGSMW